MKYVCVGYSGRHKTTGSAEEADVGKNFFFLENNTSLLPTKKIKMENKSCCGVKIKNSGHYFFFVRW